MSPSVMMPIAVADADVKPLAGQAGLSEGQAASYAIWYCCGVKVSLFRSGVGQFGGEQGSVDGEGLSDSVRISPCRVTTLFKPRTAATVVESDAGTCASAVFTYTVAPFTEY